LVDRFPGVPAKLAELVIEKWDPVTLPKLDVLFASLPTGASAEALGRVPKDVKIVDIGGDHRYVEGWAYGLADVWPAQIEGQIRVANPGCFPAATLNALAPCHCLHGHGATPYRGRALPGTRLPDLRGWRHAVPNGLLRGGRNCIEFAAALLDPTRADVALYCHADMVRAIARTCRV
jgi:hypothetical protein